MDRSPPAHGIDTCRPSRGRRTRTTSVSHRSSAPVTTMRPVTTRAPTATSSTVSSWQIWNRPRCGTGRSRPSSPRPIGPGSHPTSCRPCGPGSPHRSPSSPGSRFTGRRPAARRCSPLPSEIAAVTPALGDLSDAASGQLLRTATATLDAADAALGRPASVTIPVQGGGAGVMPVSTIEIPQQSGSSISHDIGSRSDSAARILAASRRRRLATSPAQRSRLPGVHAGIDGSAGVTVLAGGGSASPVYLPLLLIVPPALAWLAGWLIIGGLFEPAAGTTLNRTPKVGAVICYVARCPLLRDVVDHLRGAPRSG